MKTSFAFFLVINLLILFMSTQAHAIKKCKDADGKWHYGDIAVRSCEKSKVTTLTDRGFIASEKAAPKTNDEQKAEDEARMAAEEKAKIEQAEEDERNRILSVYETEADIDRQKDNQIGAINTNIVVHEKYLKDMNAKIERTQNSMQGTKGKRKERFKTIISDSEAEIEKYSKRLEDLKTQKAKIIEKFSNEKEIYRSLKSGASEGQ